VRVFIDEHLDVRLYQLFGGNFDAETADYRGWKGAQNGELMRRAAAEYDAFVTNDQKYPSSAKHRSAGPARGRLDRSEPQGRGLGTTGARRRKGAP
jgi:predicted nuclease of predicted toxin-antitoxin system